MKAEASVVRVFPGQGKVAWPDMGSLPASTMVMVLPMAGFKQFVKKLAAMFGTAEST
jgi:hypothetical protein